MIGALLVGFVTLARAECADAPRYDREACECTCDGIPVFPRSGSILPTNFVIRVRGLITYRLQRGDENLDLDVTLREHDEVLEWTELRVTTPLAPGDRVELWTPQEYPPVLLASWIVGEAADHTPPQWNGAYDVVTVNDPEDACGFAEHSHTLTWEGLTEDSAGGAVFAYAVGIEEFVSPEFGDEKGFDVRWDACRIDDLSLYEQFHRSYRVTFEDAAGNVSGPHEVRTGRELLGCGCGGPSKKEYEDDVPPVVDVASAQGSLRPLHAVPLLAWVLRRRRELDRRVTRRRRRARLRHRVGRTGRLRRVVR